jgi:catechol 2,3-dioxygenase-like lactoylglutathione lyase family enzyme
MPAVRHDFGSAQPAWPPPEQRASRTGREPLASAYDFDRQALRARAEQSGAMLTDAALVAFAATTDLERAHDFYGDVLGLRRVEATPFANVYDADGTTLRVTRVDEVARGAYTVLGWSVPDIHRTIASLSDGGVAFERFPGVEQDSSGVWTAPGGAQIAWFRDPDGNVLSLTQDPPPI